MKYTAKNRIKSLKEAAQAFKYFAAGSFGAVLVVTSTFSENHPIVSITTLCALFFMWCAYQVGEHISRIERNQKDIEENNDSENDRILSRSLEYSVDEPLWRIILP